MIHGELRGARQGGFTYLVLLFALAILSLTMALYGSLYSFERQREKEKELLRAGREIARAIQMYHRGNPPNTPATYPTSFDDLLEDPRYPFPRRYLRRIPLDPMTGTHDWGMKQLDGGQIVGVFSTSEKTPLKSGNFRPEEKDFASASSYQGWEFVAAAPPTASGPNAAPVQQNSPDQGNSPGQGTPHNR